MDKNKILLDLILNLIEFMEEKILKNAKSKVVKNVD